MQKSKNILLMLLAGYIMMACQDVTRPSGVLSQGDFEDVLYDIHLSHHLEYDKPNGDTLTDAAHRYALTLDVLKKYDISQAEWDSSVVYYTRNSTQLKEIYNNLYERLSYLTEGSVDESVRDSSDIWKDERHLLLTSQRGNTTMQWTVNADTLLQPGEKLNLCYTCLFLNSQAQNRLMTVMTIRLKNDSVVVRNQVSNQTGLYDINIADDQNIGIKSINGYFMVMHPSADNFGGMRDLGQQRINSNIIVSIADIRLTHEAPKNFPPTGSANSNDTINNHSHPNVPDGRPLLPGNHGIHGMDNVSPKPKITE